VAFASDGRGGCRQIAGGTRALGSTDGGSTWATSDSSGGGPACALRLAGGTATVVTKGPPQDGFTLLTTAGPSAGWGRDGTGQLVRTRDGGVSWVTVDLTSGDGPQALSFAAAPDGWMLTSDGRLLRTIDGATTWAQIS